MDRKITLPQRLFVIAFILVWCFLRNASEDSENPEMQALVPVVVAGIFLIAFGMLIWQGIKEWRKSDEEILAGFTPMVTMLVGTGEVSPSRGFQVLGGGVVITAIFLYKAWGSHAFVGSCIFCGIFLSVIAIPTLYTWHAAQTAAHSTPPKKPRITGEQIAALLIGLLSCGFFCVFIGIGFWYGVWMFALPPGLCFLFVFSRNLVAAVRTMLRPVETEKDPWEKPDITR